MSGAEEVQRRGPDGSRYEADVERRAPRSLRRRLRQAATRPAIALVAWTFPYLYYAYCWFVWRTSRVRDRMDPLRHALDRHGRTVGLLWHQEVFTVAYAFRGFYGHTLASTGNFGRIITRMLELCNFTVFRGGSSRGGARRRRVLVDMIRHMQREPRVVYGITVDGSAGPPYVMKSGGPAIGRACRAPLFVVRTWYQRRLTFPSWDRTGFPLPFNRIEMVAVGPYWIDPDGGDVEFQAAHAHLQEELRDLCYQSHRWTSTSGEAAPPQGFPLGWRPRWGAGQRGIARGPFDLRPDSPPPWAHYPGQAEAERPDDDDEPDAPRPSGASSSTDAGAPDASRGDPPPDALR